MVRAPYGESSDQVVDEGQHGHELSSGGHSATHGARSSAEAGAVLQPAIYAVRTEHMAAGALDGIAVHTQADRAHEFIRRSGIEVLGRIYGRVRGQICAPSGVVDPSSTWHRRRAEGKGVDPLPSGE